MEQVLWMNPFETVFRAVQLDPVMHQLEKLDLKIPYVPSCLEWLSVVSKLFSHFDALKLVNQKFQQVQVFTKGEELSSPSNVINKQVSFPYSI